MTVLELKEIIQDWPEVDAEGSLAEVWMETSNCLSSIVSSVVRLNQVDMLFISPLTDEVTNNGKG